MLLECYLQKKNKQNKSQKNKRMATKIKSCQSLKIQNGVRLKRFEHDNRSYSISYKIGKLDMSRSLNGTDVTANKKVGVSFRYKSLMS